LELTHFPKAFAPFPFVPYLCVKSVSPRKSRSASQNFAAFL
jgi:hypothetical protein